MRRTAFARVGQMARGILVLAVVLGGGSGAWAYDSACDEQDVNGDGEVNNADWSGIVYKQVIYEAAVTTPFDLRADSSGLVRLRGWLYYPAGRPIKDARVIIYNHGHDKGRNEPCAIASYFVSHGFVVFAPLRRGHSAKTPDPEPANWHRIESTGVHTDDYVLECAVTNCLNQARCNFPLSCTEGLLEVDYMRRQVIDVADEIEYIKSLPATSGPGRLADPTRIALLGHSFGGSLTLLANADVHGHAVAVSISGAELSWDQNPYWEEYLTPAVGDARRPMYFLQPKNGRSLGPTRVLSRVALNHEYRFQAAVFANAPWNPASENPEWSQAHGNFITDLAQVESWGPSVIDFLRRNALPPPPVDTEN